MKWEKPWYRWRRPSYSHHPGYSHGYPAYPTASYPSQTSRHSPVHPTAYSPTSQTKYAPTHPKLHSSAHPTRHYPVYPTAYSPTNPKEYAPTHPKMHSSAHPTRQYPAHATKHSPVHHTAYSPISPTKYAAVHPTRYPLHHAPMHPTIHHPVHPTTHKPATNPTTIIPVYPTVNRPVYRPNPVIYPVLAPSPYYPNIYYPAPQRPPPYVPPTTTRSNPARTLLLLYTFMNLLSPSTTAATTTSESTTFPGTCQWGPWSSCSAVCKGTRTRSRMCTGNTQMDSEDCNTETGFRSDGIWYRAANCLEYLWSTDTVTSKADAVTACSSRGSRLASTGLRNDDVRTDIVFKFASKEGIDNLADAYVGISNMNNVDVYVWTDGHEGDPTFWANNEPTGGLATDCIRLEKGNPHGLRDDACDVTPYNYFCEREIP